MLKEIVHQIRFLEISCNINNPTEKIKIKGAFIPVT